jgi:hypothetical protein
VTKHLPEKSAPGTSEQVLRGLGGVGKIPGGRAICPLALGCAYTVFLRAKIIPGLRLTFAKNI